MCERASCCGIICSAFSFSLSATSTLLQGSRLLLLLHRRALVGPVWAVCRCGGTKTMRDVSTRALSTTVGILSLFVSARQQAYCMRCGSTTATSGRGSLQHRGEQRHQPLTPMQSAVRNTYPGGATAWLVGPGISPTREAAGTVAATATFAGGALRMMAESGAPPAKKGKGKGPYKVIATNKKARRNYEILEKFVAGIELVGSEVKSCRMSKINMDEGFAQAKKGQCFLHGIHIAECGVSNRFYQHEPRRPRRLLLHKREIKKLEDKVAQKGMTVVPLKIFFDDNNRLKVEIGLALGKNVRDKREDIKARDAKRDIQRISKNAY